MDLVKVGGSLCRREWQDALVDWLEQRARQGPLLVVSGGGAHADTVRAEQQRLGSDALTAHRQALLAMEQQAWWLHATWARRHGRQCPVDASARAGTLWTPRALIEDPGEVEVSWAVTSDSLAAWLASRCTVGTLWLLKSIDQAEAAGGPAEWAAQGWVDERFPDYAGRAACTIRLLGRAGWGS